jgi:hypothetical protein
MRTASCDPFPAERRVATWTACNGKAGPPRRCARFSARGPFEQCPGAPPRSRRASCRVLAPTLPEAASATDRTIAQCSDASQLICCKLAGPSCRSTETPSAPDGQMPSQDQASVTCDCPARGNRDGWHPGAGDVAWIGPAVDIPDTCGLSRNGKERCGQGSPARFCAITRWCRMSAGQVRCHIA